MPARHLPLFTFVAVLWGIPYPVVAVVPGVTLLGERPGQLAPLGLSLILAGSWLASRADAPAAARMPGERAEQAAGA